MKVNLRMIEEFCNKYTNSGNSDMYVGKQIPPEKLRMATKNFPIEGAKVAYLLYDTSTFNKCKTGFAICDNGVFFNSNKFLYGGSRHFTWEEFANCRIYRSEYELCFDEKYKVGDFDYEITIYGDDARYKIEELLEAVQDIVLYHSEEGDYEDYQVEESEEEEYIDDVPDMPKGNSKDSKWMLATGGTQYGPLSEDEVKKMFDKGTINPVNTYLWRKGMEEWELIINIDTFISYMRKSNPKLVPPPLPKKWRF